MLISWLQALFKILPKKASSKESSFGGPVIYENKEFVSPSQIRSDIRLGKAGRYNERTAQGQSRKGRKGELGLRTGEGEHERDELSDAVLFA